MLSEETQRQGIVSERFRPGDGQPRPQAFCHIEQRIPNVSFVTLSFTFPSQYDKRPWDKAGTGCQFKE